MSSRSPIHVDERFEGLAAICSRAEDADEDGKEGKWLADGPSARRGHLVRLNAPVGVA
jgi:hypothetical protein